MTSEEIIREVYAAALDVGANDLEARVRAVVSYRVRYPATDLRRAVDVVNGVVGPWLSN